MQRRFLALALAAFVGTPLAAPAQSGAAPDTGPPPAMRAKMEAIGAQAKADSYAALSADHRAKVTAIVGKVTAGTLDPHAAGTQIDALLTPDETAAVLAIAGKSRAQMQAAFGGSMPPRPPDGHRQMTAGGFLVRVSLTPEQMRALRGNGGPGPSGPPPQ